MKRDLRSLENQTFDVVVIGGGIFGACAAWDASIRGLSVALVERADFGGGASANSFKVIHGGIRYLQHLDLVRLRASSNERAAWLRIAPHLVTPLPIVIPTYGHGREGKAFLGAGMLVYDFLTLDRNRGFADEQRHIPFTRFLGRSEIENMFPGIRSDGLTGGAVFHDGQMYNPTRLVLAFVRSAVERGACATNYVEAADLIREGDRVAGVEVLDRITGERVQVRARSVLNAAGPWVPWMALSDSLATAKQGVFSRDACFLIRRRFDHRYGIAAQGSSSDPDALLGRSARHMFLLPWRQYTLCGVWHVVWETHPETVHVSQAELEAFVADMNFAFPELGLRIDDVTIWNAGLVPFGENEPGAKNLSYGKRSHIVDHAETDNLGNLVSLVGIRYTMARRDASKAVDLLCRKLGAGTSSTTDTVKVDGGHFERFDGLVAEIARALSRTEDEDAVVALAHNYGSEYRRILRLIDENPRLAEPLSGTTTFKAEIVNAIRDEMAIRLTDIVFRRTDLATGGHPGAEPLSAAGTLAAQEMGWNSTRLREELAAVERRFQIGNPLA